MARQCEVATVAAVRGSPEGLGVLTSWEVENLARFLLGKWEFASEVPF